MRTLRSSLLVFLLGAVALASQAHAQSREARRAVEDDGSERRAMAEMLFFTGRGLMEAGRYAEACTKLAESHRLDAASGTLLNLAVCHEKEGKIASAWGEFRQAMVEARRAGRGDREELAREHASALEPELPMLTISVSPAVQRPGLEVLRNGVRIAPGAWATELPVDPGRVDVVVQAPGFEPRTHSVIIAQREHRTITAEALTPAPAVVRPPSYWTRRRKIGLGLMVGSALVAGFGGTAGVLALRERKESDDGCPIVDGERRCTQAGVDAMDRARSWALMSDVGLGVGVLGLATGAILFATGGHERKRASPAEAHAARGTSSRATAWSWALSPSLRGASGLVRRSF